jgi:hypothetical protein
MPRLLAAGVFLVRRLLGRGVEIITPSTLWPQRIALVNKFEREMMVGSEEAVMRGWNMNLVVQLMALITTSLGTGVAGNLVL